MKKDEQIEKETEKRYKKRDRRKNPKMKVSGKQVLKLKKIIGERG